MKKIFNGAGKRTQSIGILLPGMRPQIESYPLYEDIKKLLLRKNISFLRLEPWKDIQDLSEKTIRELFEGIYSEIDKIKRKGYNKIYLFGKSFGGGLALTIKADIEKTICIAPAFRYGTKSNFRKISKTRLGDIKGVLDICINSKDLSKINTLIVHGTGDDIIPISNTEKIIEENKYCKILKIQAGTHSDFNSEQRKEIIKAIEKFL